MGSLPMPQVHSQYHADIPPLMLVATKLKKVKIPYVPFTSIHPTDT